MGRTINNKIIFQMREYHLLDELELRNIVIRNTYYNEIKNNPEVNKKELRDKLKEQFHISIQTINKILYLKKCIKKSKIPILKIEDTVSLLVDLIGRYAGKGCIIDENTITNRKKNKNVAN